MYLDLSASKRTRVAAIVLASGLIGVFLGGCGTAHDRPPGGETATGPAPVLTPRVPPLATSCTTPNEGCDCTEEGQELDCGKVTETHGDYVTCSAGTRTCSGGVWGECIGERVTLRSSGTSATPAPRLQAIGQPSMPCAAGFDACDPYCNLATDTPDPSLPAEPGFQVTPGGMTLVETAVIECTSLTLTPSAPIVYLTGTSLSSLASAPVTFTLTAWPLGCTPVPFATTWTINRFDRATITGTTNQNGSLAVVLPIAGNIQVTAYAAGLSVTTSVGVDVNVVVTPASDALAAPNQAASLSAAQVLLLATVPTGATSATWLYPYPNTYFPLGLPAPVVQYRYAYAATGDETAAASAVKVSLRYPINTTAAGASFNYSLVVRERNALTCAQTPAQCNYLDPQIVIPELAWDYLEQTARGQATGADLIVQRLRNRSGATADVLEPESRLRIYLADAQLKGTVYYNSYTSPQGGNTGAILSIAPGATSPTLAVQPLEASDGNGTCTTCHSINIQGTRLITNGYRSWGGAYTYDTSRQFNMTTVGPTPDDLLTFTTNRFTFGGPWTDGSLYMTHGGTADPAWHAPPGASLLYRVSAPDTAITPTGWRTNVQATTPRFSPDGTKLAFGFWGGDTLAKLPSGTLSSVAAGTRLAVMNFTCASPPCTGTSNGWAVSNARDLTPGVTERVAWPSFTPSGNSVIYQRQYRSSKALFLNAWTPSDIGTVAGALAELWISNVPTNSTSLPAATPTRLLALNGLSSTGTTYLPQQARTLISAANPLYTYPVARHDMSQSGGSGTRPSVVLTGAPNGGPWDFRIDITNGGALGTATFRYSTNGGSTWITPDDDYGGGDTAAIVQLDDTGLNAEFGATSGSNYSSSSIYKALVGQVGLSGTPQNGATQWDVRIDIEGATGNRGTARFRYSTDGGLTWTPSSGTMTLTAASVTLGTTGLVATFGNVNYESTSWAYGAYVTHFHQDNARFTMNQADNCARNATAASVSDHRLNYLPSVAPTDAGGKSWVVFTSRRMYGNVAHQDPWDAEPGYSCYSGGIPTKKLWVAAVNSTWTPGSDPSHPAFYLPGQELAAGNSDGFWVNEPCTAVSGSCQSDDDCCGGTGSSPTTQCRVTSTASFPPVRQCASRSTCAAEGISCTATSECCSGLVCPTGGGLCVHEPDPLFERQEFEREYVAECPYGTVPKWRFLEWQSTIPAGTSIEFFVQTKRATSDAYGPAMALLAATDDCAGGAPACPAPSVWRKGASTVDQVLEAGGLASAKYLLVTMAFNPDTSQTRAPTLRAWRQIHDCVPGQ